MKSPLPRAKAIIGMVHVGALPGAPRSEASVAALAEQAAAEARLLADAGFDALMIENMHDTPYLRRDVGPEVVAAMTRVAHAVRTAAPALPLGVQVLAGANRAALAVAHATGATFIRAEGFVFSSVADEGLFHDADAGPLLRYRRSIGAIGVSIFVDVKKKHSAHAITADVPIGETAQAAEFFGADGVVVTGAATGRPAAASDLAEVRDATRLPVLVGSGAAPAQLADLFRWADGVIVGSWIKRDGVWSNAIDPDRARAFVQAAEAARR